MRTLIKFALLGLVMAALALGNLYMSAQPVDVSAISTASRTTGELVGDEAGNDETGTGHIEELTFVQTFSRPLFNQDRRKYQPPKPKPKPAPKPKKVAKKPPPKKVIQPPQFRLIGISYNGSSARALIASVPNVDPQWIAEGETIDQWTLTKIAKEGITVTQAGTEVSIGLYPDRN